jgi:hypothetical protein
VAGAVATGPEALATTIVSTTAGFITDAINNSGNKQEDVILESAKSYGAANIDLITGQLLDLAKTKAFSAGWKTFSIQYTTIVSIIDLSNSLTSSNLKSQISTFDKQLNTLNTKINILKTNLAKMQKLVGDNEKKLDKGFLNLINNAKKDVAKSCDKANKSPSISSAKTKLGDNNNIIINVSFKDPDGDVVRLEFMVTGAISHFWTADMRNITKAQQIKGVKSGEWIIGQCPQGGGGVDMVVSAVDAMTNVSNIYSVQYNCKSSSSPVMLNIGSSSDSGNGIYGDFYFQDPDGDVDLISIEVTGAISAKWTADMKKVAKSQQIKGVWSKNWTLGKCPADGGSYAISAYAADKVGNVSNSMTQSYSCPGTAPGSGNGNDDQCTLIPAHQKICDTCATCNQYCGWVNESWICP